MADHAFCKVCRVSYAYHDYEEEGIIPNVYTFTGLSVGELFHYLLGHRMSVSRVMESDHIRRQNTIKPWQDLWTCCKWHLTDEDSVLDFIEATIVFRDSCTLVSTLLARDPTKVPTVAEMIDDNDHRCGEKLLGLLRGMIKPMKAAKR